MKPDVITLMYVNLDVLQYYSNKMSCEIIRKQAGAELCQAQ